MTTHDLQCTMSEVVSLLPLEIRHRRASSLDCDCPMCHGRGKLNINLTKEVFRCNRCGVSGGMLALYANVFGVSNSEAYAEICSILHRGKAPRVAPQPVPMAVPVTTIQQAPAPVIDQTLRTMLSLLPLAATHRDDLLRRGLNEGEIERYLFRSTPAFGAQNLARKLLELGCTLEGVPGFYRKDGAWTMACSPKASGYFVPVLSLTGLIQGCQIRLDRPFSKCKYIWFSSSEREGGTGSGSPVHVIGGPSKTVFVTEGPLKATVAHCLSGHTFVAVAGAGQYGALAPVLERLQTLGTQTVLEAYDMDKLQNESVANGVQHFLTLAQDKGLKVRQLKWDPAYKGVDDFYLARRNAQQIRG